jgi:linoleate 10R-lipoxygenase
MLVFIILLFSRGYSHLPQYIAEKLLDINENGTFSNPPTNAKDRLKQDDELFQRARLVNSGFFMQIILGGTSLLYIM